MQGNGGPCPSANEIDIRGVCRGTAECIPEGPGIGLCRAVCGPQTGLVIPTGLETLKQGPAVSGASPKSVSDRFEGTGV